MDATAMVDYNMEIINSNDLEHSFFQMSREDPTVGFEFDASTVAGHTYPADYVAHAEGIVEVNNLTLRLRLGSHLAMYMRHQLEQQKGYTSTVGIGTNKLLSKLVGSLNKPKGQTTLMPPLDASGGQISNAIAFMDDHEIGKVPGIGFKSAQKLREFVLQRSLAYDFTDGGPKELVTVASVRIHPDINFEKLESLLGGPGSSHGIGYKVWCLLRGVDDAEVSQARPVPRQISIEDSYRRLATMSELLKELTTLAESLIKRMRTDLLADEDDFENINSAEENGATEHWSPTMADKKWLAHPKTLRLTTRPKLPLQPDGTRPRTMKRISHSCPLPNFVFSLSDSVDALAEKLVQESLLTMFRKLHTEKTGWNLSLVNIAVTNMAETAGESKTANGRNIGNMFKRQDDVLKDFRVTDTSSERRTYLDEEQNDSPSAEKGNSTPVLHGETDQEWDDGDGMDAETEFCLACSSHIPAFAMVAHQRFHSPGVQ